MSEDIVTSIEDEPLSAVKKIAKKRGRPKKVVEESFVICSECKSKNICRAQGWCKRK